jgi:class 3 adenylate cyclase
MTGCGRCGAANDVANAFCGQCGAPLSFDTRPAETSGERRQLTVMFCDMVGSTRLAEQLDPEDWLEVLRAYQVACAEVVSRYEGHIAKYIGDGMLVYFGHPNAHEDDPRRSVLAGLGFVRAIDDLNSRLVNRYGIRLQIRIGIHTGLVIVGQVGAGETLEENAIVGETPNIAARLEAIAPPDGVVISHTTRHLVQGLFTLKDLGLQQLKGVSQLVPVSLVGDAVEETSSFVTRARRGLTPLVGRQEEILRLEELWQQAIDGSGSVVLVTGEPGVGKSRLLETLKQSLTSTEIPHQRLQYQCSAYHINSAFYPLISAVTQTLRRIPDQEGQTPYEKLVSFLGQFDINPAHAPIFAQVLSIELPQGVVALEKPEVVKKTIFEDWFGLVNRMSESGPLLLVLEDAHWIDPSTRELVMKLVDWAPAHRILALVTRRPAQGFDSESASRFQDLTLDRLNPDSNREMVNKVVGDAVLPPELVDLIVRKTDGVPLYIEELTKTVLESDMLQQREGRYELSGPLPSLAIPTSLQDSLMSRLDRLSTIKDVVQVAATIGRRFSLKLLEDVTNYGENLLQDALQRLMEAELVYPVDDAVEDTYEFKHALVQDAAYQSLLRSTRRQYHDQIAKTLETGSGNPAEARPEILAYHYTEAAKAEKAIHYWLEAGKRASETSSHLEATAHLEKGLQLVRTLPAGKERDEREFQLQIRYIGPLMTARGYTAPESEEAVNHALALSKRVDECPEIFPVLGTRYHFLQAAGLVSRAADVGNEFMKMAEKQNTADLLIAGYRMQGASLFLSGDSAGSQPYWQRLFDLYEPEAHKSLAYIYGQDLNVLSLGYRSLACWHQGDFAGARQSAAGALDYAADVDHPNTTCVALFWNAMTYFLLEEPEQVKAHCETLNKLCEELNIPLWLSVGNILIGWAKCRLGDMATGLTHIDKGFSAYDAMKIGLFRPLMIIARAQALIATGSSAEAIADVRQSIERSRAGGELWLDAMGHTLLGDLLVQSDPDATKDAEIAWQDARRIAVAQNSPPQQNEAESRLNKAA